MSVCWLSGTSFHPQTDVVGSVLHQEGPLLKIYYLLQLPTFLQLKKKRNPDGTWPSFLPTSFLLMERKDKIWVSHYFPEVLGVRRGENMLHGASGFSLRKKKEEEEIAVKSHKISRSRRIFLFSPSRRLSDFPWLSLISQREGPRCLSRLGSYIFCSGIVRGRS